MTTAQTSWDYEYLPYTGQDGREIPCFRIYPPDAPEAYIAETNEHLPHAVQGKYACLIAAAPELLTSAQMVVARWDQGDLAEAVRDLAAAIARATGRAP